MYILIIARGYPSDKYKMNGIFEFDQAKALAQAGYKVIYGFVDVRSIRNRRKLGFESFKSAGVQIEGINIPYGNLPFLEKIKIWALRILYRRIREKYGEPKIVHSHFITYNYAAAHVFKETKIPLVMTEHYSNMNQKEIKPYFKKLGDYSYSKADKVIAVSNYLAKNISEKFKIDVEVIPNIIDLECFNYKNFKRDPEPFIFVSTGRLSSNKRMDLLIKAFYKAFKTNENVKLYIFGDGPERNKLEELIEDYNLQNRVFLMGLLSRKDIAHKMQESHCFVLASRLETFGVAYIEAMAMGLPVISTKCGGPEDFINLKNGKIVPVDNVDALSNSMLNIYSDIDKYNRKEIAEEAKKRFSPKAIANDLHSLYNEIIYSKDNGDIHHADKK